RRRAGSTRCAARPTARRPGRSAPSSRGTPASANPGTPVPIPAARPRRPAAPHPRGGSFWFAWVCSFLESDRQSDGPLEAAEIDVVEAFVAEGVHGCRAPLVTKVCAQSESRREPVVRATRHVQCAPPSTGVEYEVEDVALVVLVTAGVIHELARLLQVVLRGAGADSDVRRKARRNPGVRANAATPAQRVILQGARDRCAPQ